jgi:uncharacterized damage-inducible protein DinB
MTATAAAPDVAGFRHQARIVHQVLRLNAEGLTHEESLIQPSPAGNCLNFVVGHVLWVYNNVLAMLQQEPVMAPGSLDRYARGAPPITDAAEAIPLATLLEHWDTAAARIDAGLAELTPEFLDQRAATSPSNDPDETNRSLLSTVFFHQAYHSGQAGLLRRIAGKPGAIP